MNINGREIPRTAVLAPMAGFTDRAFREICIEMGAAYVCGEMASSKGISYQSEKSRGLLSVDEASRPLALQIFGDEPDTMRCAAEEALKNNPEFIDINMGCPAPKITGGGSGCALMKNPELAGRIIKAVAEISPVPVTVKIRAGWDSTSINAVEIAKIAEENGAAAVTVHGRTRAQMYSGQVDKDIIRAVKNSISIPVIGNGDINSAEDAKEMYTYTGCDLVMVGRGALGKPWLFTQIRDYILNGVITPEPGMEERMKILYRHIALMCRYKGERVGMREARGHIPHYLKGFPRAAELRSRAAHVESLEDLKEIINTILRGCLAN